MKSGIILFIVEGPSDYPALMPYIEKKLLSLRLRISVKEMHGDILTEYIQNTRQYRVTSGNVKGELKQCILNFLSSQSVRTEGIRTKDIRKIYYVTDTDYCFYGKEPHHKNKAECLQKIFHFNTIELVKKKGIPFETIFFSKHLEHVIDNNIHDVSDQEKEKIAFIFSNRAMKEENFFVDFFYSRGIMKWNSYRESYDNIRDYQGRACNMNNFIEEFGMM